jgi:hypothetical protein
MVEATPARQRWELSAEIGEIAEERMGHAAWEEDCASQTFACRELVLRRRLWVRQLGTGNQFPSCPERTEEMSLACGYSRYGPKSLAGLPLVWRRSSHEIVGRVVLSEFGVPAVREARSRKSDGVRSDRQGQGNPAALLPGVQGAVLGAQGDAALLREAPGEERAVDPEARSGGLWRAAGRAAGEGIEGHGQSVHLAGWRSRSGAARRTGRVSPSDA